MIDWISKKFTDLVRFASGSCDECGSADWQWCFVEDRVSGLHDERMLCAECRNKLQLELDNKKL